MIDRLIGIEEAKMHLNIEDDHLSDDWLLYHYVDTAHTVVEAEICRELSDLNPNEMAIARQAILLLVGDFYMQREDTVVGATPTSVPMGVKRLCFILRKF